MAEQKQLDKLRRGDRTEEALYLFMGGSPWTKIAIVKMACARCTGLVGPVLQDM